MRSFERLALWIFDSADRGVFATSTPFTKQRHWYVMQLIAPHWTLIGGLVRRTGGTATVAFYPLAPKHDCRQGLDAADKAFDELARYHCLRCGPA